jgi:hypothetical protein
LDWQLHQCLLLLCLLILYYLGPRLLSIISQSVDIGTPTKSLPLKNMIDTTVEVYQLFMPSCVLFYLSFSLIVYSRCLPYVFVWLVETLLLPPVTNIKRLTLVNRGCIICLCVNSYFFLPIFFCLHIIS